MSKNHMPGNNRLIRSYATLFYFLVDGSVKLLAVF
jgi:hypothetical protein